MAGEVPDVPEGPRPAPTPRAMVLDAAHRFAALLGPDATAVTAALDAWTAGAPTVVLSVRCGRVLATADPDQEWSEWSEHAELRVTAERVVLGAYRNLATMVGAQQDGTVECVCGRDGEPADLDREPADFATRLATWWATADEILADPARTVSVDATTLPPAATGPVAGPAADEGRSVVLREEHHGDDHRWLRARVDGAGDLHIEGHDLGPGTTPVSGDGEYEWETIVRRADVGWLRSRYAIAPDEDLLDALEARWSGPASYDFEARLRDGSIRIERTVWGG